jgi:hypothetical protein
MPSTHLITDLALLRLVYEISSLLAAMSTVAPPSAVRCGLLTIPPEIRNMVFEFLFADSCIVIKYDHEREIQIGDNEVTVKQTHDLTDFHPAITMTSKQIRSETVEVLERMTELQIIGAAVEELKDYLVIFSCPSLKRIQKVSVIHIDECHNERFGDVWSFFDNLKIVNICGNLVDCSLHQSEIIEVLTEYDDESDEEEPLNDLDSWTQIFPRASRWVGVNYEKHVMYSDKEELCPARVVKVVLIVPYGSNQLEEMVRDALLQRTLLDV